MGFGPKPKPLSGDWQALLASPLVQDTLVRLFGGQLPVFQQTNRLPFMSDDVMGMTPLAGDTVSFYSNAASPYVLLHEMGHVLQARHMAPMAEAAIVSDPKNRPKRGSYAETSDDEHISEAFARAMASGRRGFADSTEAQEEQPGAIEFIRWLLGQPPFHQASAPAQQSMSASPQTGIAFLLPFLAGSKGVLAR